jgi:hypothetical protein
MLLPKLTRCKRCRRAMEMVVEIAPFGGSPGLATFLCLECGSVENTLIPAVGNATRPMTKAGEG